MTERRRNGRPALDLCEEAIHLLRQAPSGTIAIYYLGSVPFILALLFFLSDMASSATALDHCAPAALGLTFLYLWMNTCQAVFGRQLRGRLSAGLRDPLPARRWLQIGLTQAAVQPFKLIVLPISFLLMFPFASVLAFFHNAGSLDGFEKPRRQSTLFSAQNWTFLGILTLLWFVVFANVGMAVIALPYLAKMLGGVDSVFTRGTAAFLNSTFLLVTFALTYLVLNPFVRAFYTLRCFYGESLTTAEDLRLEWRTSTAAIVCLLAMFCTAPARAQDPNLARDLNQSIEKVLEKPEYTWRTARSPHPADRGKNWFVRATLGFLDWTGRGMQKIGNWIDDFADWLSKRFGHSPPNLPDAAKIPPPARSLRIMVVCGLAILVGIVAFLLIRLLANRRAAAPSKAAAVPASLDLLSDDLQPDQQAPEQWFETARECIGRGEFRLALRALYLAGLSSLAGEQLIALNRAKSDRDYARELNRRVRHQPELVAAFNTNLQLFERGWYGMYDVDTVTIAEFETNLDKMRKRAQ